MYLFACYVPLCLLCTSLLVMYLFACYVPLCSFHTSLLLERDLCVRCLLERGAGGVRGEDGGQGVVEYRGRGVGGEGGGGGGAMRGER